MPKGWKRKPRRRPAAELAGKRDQAKAYRERLAAMCGGGIPERLSAR